LLGVNEPQADARSPGATFDDGIVREYNPESNRVRNALQVYSRTFNSQVDLSPSTIKQYLREGKYFMLCLPDQQDRDKIVACAFLADLKKDFVMLEYLFVDQQRSGKGIGTKFFTQIKDYLRLRMSKKFMMLECLKRLVGWYSRMGAVDPKLNRQHWVMRASDHYREKKTY